MDEEYPAESAPTTGCKPPGGKTGKGFQATICKLPEIFSDLVAVRRLQATQSRLPTRRRSSGNLETISEGKDKGKKGGGKKQKLPSNASAKNSTVGKHAKTSKTKSQSQKGALKKEKGSSAQKSNSTSSLASSSTPKLPTIFELTATAKLYSTSQKHMKATSKLCDASERHIRTR